MYLKLILRNTKKRREKKIPNIDNRRRTPLSLNLLKKKKREDEKQQTNNRKYSTINYANKESKITERTNN